MVLLLQTIIKPQPEQNLYRQKPGDVMHPWNEFRGGA